MGISQMTTRFPKPSLLLTLILLTNSCWAADRASLDWVHDALVVAMPAAAVGGSRAGVYTRRKTASGHGVRRSSAG